MTKAFRPALQSACAALYLIAGAASSIAEDAKGPVPRKVGQCVRIVISELGSRLDGAPDSGSAVAYANGPAQLPAGRRQGQGLFCCQLADEGALVSS